jgi:hypothetical protein
MSSGAFALYVDLQAGIGGGGGGGGGAGAAINRIVPLPRSSNQDEIDFHHRRLTLYYDNNLITGAPSSVTVTGRFFGVSASPINVTVNAGECHVVEIPRQACAASLHVDPLPAPGVRGPLSALVEYSN